MARSLFVLEKGLRMVGENTDVGVDLLFGSGAPGSGSPTDDAAVGSLYQRTDSSGELYRKKTAGTGTDKWVRILTYDDFLSFSFRDEKVTAATGDAAPISGSVIDLVATPFGDDDNPDLVAADFAVNDHIIFGVGGTPKLMRVSVVSAPNITVVDADDALAANDKFVVKYYLPDSPNAQEVQALVFYTGSAIVKLGDVNWEYATGIKLSGAYTPANGTVAASDTVEAAIQKLDANQADLITLSGVAQGAVDLGTFTGTIIADSSTIKSALQQLETDMDAIQTALGIAAEATHLGTFTGDIIPDSQSVKSALQYLETEIDLRMKQSKQAAITTAVTLDEINVDLYKGAVWEVTLSLDSNPAQVEMLTVKGVHDGVIAPGTPADAVNVDQVAFGKVKLGSNFNYSVAIDLSGTGGSQVMRLRISASAAITAVAVRYALLEA